MICFFSNATYQHDLVFYYLEISFFGVIAQLVERDVRIVEVGGSTPLDSTILYVKNHIFAFSPKVTLSIRLSVTEALQLLFFVFNKNLMQFAYSPKRAIILQITLFSPNER